MPVILPEGLGLLLLLDDVSPPGVLPAAVAEAVRMVLGSDSISTGRGTGIMWPTISSSWVEARVCCGWVSRISGKSDLGGWSFMGQALHPSRPSRMASSSPIATTALRSTSSQIPRRSSQRTDSMPVRARSARR